MTKWIWIIQETFGSNFSPEFAHLFIYLSSSWGCAYKQMDLSSCTRISLPHQAPEYSNTALHPSWRRSPDTRKVQDWCDTFCFEIRLLCTTHKILGSVLTGWKTEKSRRENWATKSCLRDSALVSNRMDSLTLTQENCAGIIQVTHSFLIFMFQNKSVPTPKNNSIFWAGLQEPIVRARPNFLIKLAHSFSFNLIKISFWKQANCFQNLDSSWQVLWETLSTSCVWFCFPIQNWGRQLVWAFKYL